MKSRIIILSQILGMFTLSLFFIHSCDIGEIPIEPEQKSGSSLDKESGSKTPTTDVHGYVTLNSSPYSGMNVYLKKGTSVLDSTVSDATGYYTICVCNQFAGTGYYTVYTEIIVIRGDDYQGTATFYWDEDDGPWDFERDLPIVKITSK